ncbi:hypothetical protein V3H44_21120 [Vibrio parahaemolyticus]|nr:hypothetical protein [Vibrio parahaemolyticus]
MMFKEQLLSKKCLLTGVHSPSEVDELMTSTFSMRFGVIEPIEVSKLFPLGGYTLERSGWEVDALKLPNGNYLLIDRQESHQLVDGLLDGYNTQMTEYKEYLKEQHKLAEVNEQDTSLDMLEADSTKHATLDTLEEDSTNHLTMEKLHEEEGIECQ